MFRFVHPVFLYFLLIIPLLIGLFIITRIKRSRMLKQYGDIKIIASLMPEASKERAIGKFILVMVSFALLVLIIAEPQFGSRLQEVKRKGVEIIIALDVSNSMLAEDLQPSRLERAKQSISKMVDQLDNDKLGLVVFAGDAYTQLPITSDYVSAKMFLSAISPNIVPKQGTAIGSAINLAAKSFDSNSPLQKCIILITDGENHEDDAVAAAQEASKNGIIVHAIGIGLPEGSPIPISSDNSGSSFRKDDQGNVIISKLDEGLLTQIAAAGKGKYVRASQAQMGLNTILDEISKMQKGEIEAKIYADYEEQFQPVTAIALFILLLEVIVLERKNKWMKNIHLFTVSKNI
jgi:Ca-activated chloride channel homolog